MRRQLIIGAIIIAVTIALAALLIALRTEPEERVIQETTPLVQVAPIEIRSGNLMVAASGTVRAREEVSFAAEVAGTLVYVNPNLREGQRITKGALLFRIDPVDYDNAVQVARADVASQGVAVEQAREEVALAKAELARFEQRAQAGANGLNAGAGAAGNDAITQILPPEALTANRKNGHQPNGTDAANRPGSTNDLATRQPQLLSARAGLRRAQAQLANAQTALNRTIVRAPFSGVVRSENIALGSYVQPGQSLGSIVATSEFEAIISLSEAEAALIPALWSRSGGKIEAAIFADYGGNRYRWQGYVDRANTVLNPQTRTIDVFVRIPNPMNGGALAADQNNADGQNTGDGAIAAPPLFVGSFVDAQITGRTLDQYAIVPLAALKPGNKIWLVKDGQLQIKTLKIYQRTDEVVIVDAAGLGKNPVAIVGSLKVATEGERVRIAPPRGADKKPSGGSGKGQKSKAKSPAVKAKAKTNTPS